MGHKHKKKNKNGEFIKLKEVIDYKELLKAEAHTENGKRDKYETAKFHIRKFTKVLNIKKHIENKTYKINHLYAFTIYEPKKRNITANCFDDKIVQRAVSKNILEKAIQPKLIYDDYASQVNKGTHLALDRLRHHMVSFAATENNWGDGGWIGDCDIHKFFYEIDREECFELIRALPIDTDSEDILYEQIYAIEDFDGSEIGLCIGFQSSQWLAVLYLNPLDHFIKEQLHIKYYGRYMDNFYIIHNSLEYLKYCMEEIAKFLYTDFHLKMNPKSNIHPFKQGQVFLGFHFTYIAGMNDVEIKLLNKSIKRMKKRVDKHVNMIWLGQLTVKKALESLESWNSYAKYGYTDKAKNAYKRARKQILDTEDVLTGEYDNFIHDKNGFIKLELVEHRDKDGFYVLDRVEDDRYARHYNKRAKTTYLVTNSMRKLANTW